MSNAYLPAVAAEFPNDNPALHFGARWICRNTRGAARATLRIEPATPLFDAPPPANDSILTGAPSAASLAPTSTDASGAESRYAGPLELFLDRIVLAHRVENVPPPPDFIFRPFVSAEKLAASRATPAVLGPIEPRACHVVDQRDAGRRVQRGWRVDIAPCLSVGAAAPEVTRAVAISTISVEGSRRARRRGPVLARVLAVSPVSPLPDAGELERAISELEAAFAKPALHSRPHEGAVVSSSWRASAV